MLLAAESRHQAEGVVGHGTQEVGARADYADPSAALQRINSSCWIDGRRLTGTGEHAHWIDRDPAGEGAEVHCNRLPGRSQPRAASGPGSLLDPGGQARSFAVVGDKCCLSTYECRWRWSTQGISAS